MPSPVVPASPSMNTRVVMIRHPAVPGRACMPRHTAAKLTAAPGSIPTPPMRPRPVSRLPEPTMSNHGWLPIIMVTLILRIKVRLTR